MESLQESMQDPMHDWEKPVSIDDGQEFRPRKKRRKYIARACNECKRRKIKCNGETPCHRCGRQHIECVYVENAPQESLGDQENFDRLFDQMRSMQDQITSLSAAVRSVTHSDASPLTGSRPSVMGPAPGSYAPVPSQRSLRRVSAVRETAFQGPTTSAFSFDLAKSSLQQRGIVERNEAGDGGDVTQEPSPLASPSAPNRQLEVQQAVDPLWTLSKEEALRLCEVYEEEMGVMYPVLELSELLDQVSQLYGGLMDGNMYRGTSIDGRKALDREDVSILRLVLACALTAEASGHSEQATALFDSVREVQDNCVWGPPKIKNIIFLTLVSIFYFQEDEEILAWRTIGIVERMCLERGLHRRETLSQPAIEAEGKDRVLRLFCRIAAKVWKFISAFNNTNEIKKEEMNYLDWQVLSWAQNIPHSLRLDHPSTPESGPAVEGPRSLRRLRALLYLRANQLRMLIHRPVLHTAGHIVRYPSESETVVNIAKDTIRFITRLNETSDIYQLQQVTFNWFLVSALAVIFLAVSQAPTQFSGSCKEEFYFALELVKGFSTQSYISRRLWKSIRSLRKLGPQLGLGGQRARSDEHAVGKNHVSGILDSEKSPDPLLTSRINSQTPLDGAQMTQELMEWFEAVGNVEDQIMGVGTGPIPEEGPWQQMPNGAFMFDYGGELSSVMRDCF
ncbi:hypothetical protein N7466_001088 [Penicillium verhagenii]|uniref:uncharacterized protein n=1 Tax=Penicillium verhagenii TaxID=1562060 RepID=UPI00254538D2|nr:uncharacterized protein N7466_001088 [Penicillium verhagenii]KAJ5948073.1 hypothetical protein N7466_001088 [Penicillium verhagenii]